MTQPVGSRPSSRKCARQYPRFAFLRFDSRKRLQDELATRTERFSSLFEERVKLEDVDGILVNLVYDVHTLECRLVRQERLFISEYFAVATLYQEWWQTLEAPKDRRSIWMCHERRHALRTEVACYGIHVVCWISRESDDIKIGIGLP